MQARVFQIEQHISHGSVYLPGICSVVLERPHVRCQPLRHQVFCRPTVQHAEMDFCTLRLPPCYQTRVGTTAFGGRGVTCEMLVLMTPVGVVRKGNIRMVDVAVVAKDGWRRDFIGLWVGRGSQKARKIRCLDDCVAIRNLRFTKL